MLEKLGMDYDGRPHSGLDDSKNIARIAVRMLQDGCELRINEKMHGGQLTSVSSSLPVEGAPAPQMPHPRKWLCFPLESLSSELLQSSSRVLIAVPQCSVKHPVPWNPIVTDRYRHVCMCVCTRTDSRGTWGFCHQHFGYKQCLLHSNVSCLELHFILWIRMSKMCSLSFQMQNFIGSFLECHTLLM